MIKITFFGLVILTLLQAMDAALNSTLAIDEPENIKYQIFEVKFVNDTVGEVQVPIRNGAFLLEELLRSVEEFIIQNARGFFDKDFIEIEAYAVGHIIETVNGLLSNANLPYRLDAASYIRSLLLDSQYRISSQVTNPNPLMVLFDKYYTGEI